MRFAYFAGASAAAAAACLLKAFHQRPNFYSATVYLSQSNACLLILANLVLVMSFAFMYGLQRLLYGPLRPIEIEQLSEKAWYAVLDTLLAMPSFREDVGGWLLAMFTLLLAGKVWGWIGEGRVDVLEQQPPANPRLFHIRLSTSLLLSVVFDLSMLNYCVDSILAEPRPGMMVIFTFEFAILSIFSIFTLARYGLSVIQSFVERKQMEKAIAERKEEIIAERTAARQTDASEGPRASPPRDEEPIVVDENEVDVPGWEDKRRYLFGLEVLTDFIKLLIYTFFLVVSITFNGLPMHIMRDVYMTFASFSKRVGDYIAYRKATSDMNTRYPDATTEEIRGDSCIVCREAMVAWEQPNVQQDAEFAEEPAPVAGAATRRRDEGLRAKKLPCGHILHLRCLKAWLERQQVCPTCRRPVVAASEAPQERPAPEGGANGAQPGQQPQQPQPARNRARLFNFGPVQFGLVNGPADQVGDLVRQMGDQNANNPAAQNQAPANANQQGPNHLGLQEPYLPPHANSQQSGVRFNTRPVHFGARAAVPTSVQLMQIEQRLVHEAHNLGISQQQLTILRAMEGELARLRALQMPGQPPVGTATAAQRQPLFPSAGPIPPPPTHQQILSNIPQAFQGNASVQINNESESLPEGMVLPQGWTLTPLQRLDPVNSTETHRQRGTQHPGFSHVAGNSGVETNGTTDQSNTTTQTQAAGEPEASREAGRENVPRNGDGSPLFRPTASATDANNATTVQSSSETRARSNIRPNTQTNGASQSVWGSDGWNFDDNENRTRTNHEQQDASSLSESASTSGGTQKGSTPGQPSERSRLATQVEDVPDSGE